jgi:hypothetical protein
MSDTPLTDAIAFEIDGTEFCSANHAREMERNRAMLRNAIEIIATFRDDDGQCDNGYGPRIIAKQALSELDGRS